MYPLEVGGDLVKTQERMRTHYPEGWWTSYPLCVHIKNQKCNTQKAAVPKNAPAPIPGMQMVPILGENAVVHAERRNAHEKMPQRPRKTPALQKPQPNTRTSAMSDANLPQETFRRPRGRD
jgi:hypothetical protein